MYECLVRSRQLDCVATADEPALPVFAVGPDSLDSFLAGLPGPAAAFLKAAGFTGTTGEVALIPGGNGLLGAALGVGDTNDPVAYGALPMALPPGSAWRFAEPLQAPAVAALAFLLGAYRFNALTTSPGRAPARLILPDDAVLPDDSGSTVTVARATWLARDLVNLPANLLGPRELAETARAELGAWAPRSMSSRALGSMKPIR
jgi:leucyl aminopeptidase